MILAVLLLAVMAVVDATSTSCRRRRAGQDYSPPSGTITKLTATSADSGSVMLTWNPPDADVPRSRKQGYNSKQVDIMTQQNIATMQDILNTLEQNPDLQREFHKHIVDVIRNDEAIRQDLRKEILTEELLLLPARFTRLEEDVSELKTDVSELKTDVSELKTDVSELKTDVSELKTDVNRISGQVANLTGSDYEIKAIEQSRRMVRERLDMHKAAVIFATRWDASEFEADVLLPAIEDGRITRQQANQLVGADSIVRCEDQQGAVVCAVIEISVTVQDGDRSRAAERAQLFNRATGMTTMPFVVGQEQEAAAVGSQDVPFLQYRP